MSESLEIHPPIVLFDSDASLYTFTTLDTMLGWFEPLTEEEANGCFDALARVVTVFPDGRHWSARVEPEQNGEELLRERVRAFLTRFEPDKMNLAELPTQAMIEALAALDRYAIRYPWRPFWKRRG